jgi:hypothetical protein
MMSVSDTRDIYRSRSRKDTATARRLLIRRVLGAARCREQHCAPVCPPRPPLPAPYTNSHLSAFIRIRDGLLIFARALDQLDAAERHDAPLEVTLHPLITRHIYAMQAHFVRARAGYRGEFVYA